MNGPYGLRAWRSRRSGALYENDARGIYDGELIDDIAYTLYARCRSFIAANEAVGGSAPCPRLRQPHPA